MKLVYLWRMTLEWRQGSAGARDLDLRRHFGQQSRIELNWYLTHILLSTSFYSPRYPSLILSFCAISYLVSVFLPHLFFFTSSALEYTSWQIEHDDGEKKKNRSCRPALPATHSYRANSCHPPNSNLSRHHTHIIHSHSFISRSLRVT